MANLKFSLEGKPESITVDAFVVAVSNWLKILKEVDSALSGQSAGSVDWFVSNLATSSLVVEVQGHSKLDNADFGPDVVKESISGLRRLEVEGLTPPYLSDRGLDHTKRLLQLIGSQGVTGIAITNHAEGAKLTPQALTNLRMLTRAQAHAIGSIEGRLEQISVHGRAHCTVYHHRTHKGVRCLFQPDMIGEVKEALGRRVIAAGIVFYNVKHEPIRVQLQHLRRLRSANELPTEKDIGGSDPNFTGGVESSEYIRSMRDG